jgi:hypothetical protein
MKTINDLRIQLAIYNKEKKDLERIIEKLENRIQIKIVFTELTILKFKIWKTKKELEGFT